MKRTAGARETGAFYCVDAWKLPSLFSLGRVQSLLGCDPPANPQHPRAMCQNQYKDRLHLTEESRVNLHAKIYPLKSLLPIRGINCEGGSLLHTSSLDMTTSNKTSNVKSLSNGENNKQQKQKNVLLLFSKPEQGKQRGSPPEIPSC